MKTTFDILTAARALLTPAGAWCRGAFARTADGSDANAESPDARSFCLLGAGLHVIRLSGLTRREQDDAYGRVRIALLGASESLCNIGQTIEWNDDPARTHAEVLALLDRAIEAQRAIAEAGAP